MSPLEHLEEALELAEHEEGGRSPLFKVATTCRRSSGTSFDIGLDPEPSLSDSKSARSRTRTFARTRRRSFTTKSMAKLQRLHSCSLRLA